jgi:baculoviral IAP repeat-containing protein 7/8
MKARYHTHPSMREYKTRLDTFEDWPPALAQKPEQLAEAGFFYSGQGDRTICFHCGGSISRWASTAIPWEKHARWFGHRCRFVKVMKGKDFISEYMSIFSLLPVKYVLAMLELTDVKLVPEQESEVSVKNIIDNDNDDNNLTNVNLATTCKVCMSNELSVLFIPCTHIVCCTKCALEVKNCPFCRRTIDSAVCVRFT